MNILLTGAAGFIGWRTAEFLLDRGHTVVGIDNLNDYYDVRLKHWRRAEIENHPACHFFELDIEDRARLEALFDAHSFDAVINLSARAGVRYSMENPHVYLTTNVMGTLHLLEAMRLYGVKKLVLASTSSLYAGQTMPFHEGLPVNTPISPYAASKKAAEVMAYTYHHLYQIDVSVVRYFTVYGPAGRPDMSPLRFLRWIDDGTPITLYGDGTQTRDFTYIDDIAVGTIAALRPLGYEIINLGGGRAPVSINDMIRAFEKALGKTARIDHQPFHAADMKDTSADISKARRLLGWEPIVGPPEGFRRTAEWYLTHRDWLRYIDL
ncbi:MAG: SDR family NAD(P)-dependent oxidoreductase [Opitutales bacterium]|nr:SDR family NAD(P)-dependent oxidoreductase [Opitutales bacterium]